MVLANATEVDLGLLGTARVTALLGQGGQGHVYEVQRSSGSPLALKWYRPECATDEQLQEIQTLVEFGPPHTRFLWPMSIARIAGEPGFGYVMPLRDRSFLELSHLLSNKDNHGNELDVSFASIIAICRQLGYSFLRLHARGMCYRDISFGNVFFEPKTGDVLICDNDNVGIDNGTARVLGTPFFMAPEVLRDHTYNTLPNTDTDRHSLAVLLFYTLCIGHPLEGRQTEGGVRDAAWLLRHFGTHPLFCMHPDREENRPTSAVVREYWGIYPQFLRRLFVQAFVDGISEPTRRVTEGQWIKATDRLRDGMMRCPDCRFTGFWDPAEPGRECRGCHAPLVPPLVIRIGRRTVAVSELGTLRSDHVTPGVDDSVVIGQIRAHPQAAGRWGLQNKSRQSWVAEYAGGHRVNVNAKETVELLPGMRLRLDSVGARVELP